MAHTDRWDMGDSNRFAGRVRKDGRVTIPAEMRRDLGISTGDYVVVDVQLIEGD